MLITVGTGLGYCLVWSYAFGFHDRLCLPPSLIQVFPIRFVPISLVAITVLACASLLSPLVPTRWLSLPFPVVLIAASGLAALALMYVMWQMPGMSPLTERVFYIESRVVLVSFGVMAVAALIIALFPIGRAALFTSIRRASDRIDRAVLGEIGRRFGFFVALLPLLLTVGIFALSCRATRRASQEYPFIDGGGRPQLALVIYGDLLITADYDPRHRLMLQRFHVYKLGESPVVLRLPGVTPDLLPCKATAK